MSFKKEQGSFLSSDGKTTMTYFKWSDDAKQPKAVVQLCHGMAEYIGRYDDFAAFLVGRGFAVYGMDHLGHGVNATKQTLGFFADKDGYEIITADQHLLTEIAKKENEGVPFVLYGHSMGSSVVRYYASKWSKDIDALAFSGPSGENPLVGAGLALIGIISLFKGSGHKSPFIDNMAFGKYNDRCPEKRTKFDWLSVNTENVDKYVADELCGYMFTLSAFRDLFMLIKNISDKSWPGSIRKELPVLILTGAEDPVSDYGAGAKEIEKKLVDAGLKDVTEKEYGGMRHEILNEADRQTVYDDIANWIEKRI